jgi:hypothetical protein
LGVWKRSVKLSVDIYKELYQLKDLGFKNQITRSGLSIPSNIAEELRTQIYIGIDIGYINGTKGQEWLKEANEISSMIKGLIKTRRKFTESK